MAKEAVISTDKVNSYGSRFITDGIDITQFERNPVLLYMHRRWDREDAPIGRVENLKKEGGKLVGTPVFDMDDPFAKTIANKWEKGFLRMVSPGLEPIELSHETTLVMPGQTRATITKSKLIEVSIVDIGANDDAVQLINAGKVVTLAVGEDSDFLPLLKNTEDELDNINLTNQNEMKTILLSLGLSETATPADAVAAITQLKNTADTLQLTAVTNAVQLAIDARRITADKKEHFITLGKQVGVDALTQTLNLMTPAVKPTEVINRGSETPTTELKWADLTAETAEKMKAEKPDEYAKLYKAEFGVNP